MTVLVPASARALTAAGTPGLGGSCSATRPRKVSLAPPSPLARASTRSPRPPSSAAARTLSAATAVSATGRILPWCRYVSHLASTLSRAPFTKLVWPPPGLPVV